MSKRSVLCSVEYCYRECWYCHPSVMWSISMSKSIYNCKINSHSTTCMHEHTNAYSVCHCYVHFILTALRLIASHHLYRSPIESNSYSKYKSYWELLHQNLTSLLTSLALRLQHTVTRYLHTHAHCLYKHNVTRFNRLLCSIHTHMHTQYILHKTVYLWMVSSTSYPQSSKTIASAIPMHALTFDIILVHLPKIPD